MRELLQVLDTVGLLAMCPSSLPVTWVARCLSHTYVSPVQIVQPSLAITGSGLVNFVILYCFSPRQTANNKLVLWSFYSTSIIVLTVVFMPSPAVSHHRHYILCASIISPVWGRGTLPFSPCPFTSSFVFFTFPFLSLAYSTFCNS